MLEQFLITELFAFLLVFSRVGTALMFMPGFGETYVTPRIRLLLAVFFSIIVSQLVPQQPVPQTVGALATLLIGEILTGAFLGGLARMLIGAMHVAGGIIAYQSSLASAVTNNVAGFQGQDTSMGNLLSMTAVVLIFATDLHHVMLRGLLDSYSLFLPGHMPPVEDFSQHAVRTMSGIFNMGLRLAAPLVVSGLIIYLCAGVLARLVPNIQIFFVMLPAQLLFSFYVLMVTVGGIMLWYIDYFGNAIGVFLAP